jgi:hypothetical protein
MKKRPAVPIPEVHGIDLSFRPRTYFGYPPELEQSTDGHSAINTDLKGSLDQLRAEAEAMLVKHIDAAEREAAAERDSGVDQKLVQPPDAARSKPSPPSADGTKTPSPSQGQDKKPVKRISIRSMTPEEYKTHGGWQMGTVHRAPYSQTAPDSSETKEPKRKKSPPAK